MTDQRRGRGPDEAAGGADSPLDRLVDGVEAFHAEVFPSRREQFAELAEGQHPEILFITCADSRVVPEMITQTGPGDLFVCRNIGNIVPGYGEMMGGVSAVIEYAVQALGVRAVVVCGHSDCGAMKGLLTCDEPGAMQAMPAVRNWLGNARTARAVLEATKPELEGAEKLQALVEQNVLVQLQNLRTHPSVAARLADGSLTLHGWVYDIADGNVIAHEEGVPGFAPLRRHEVADVVDDVIADGAPDHAAARGGEGRA